MYDVRSHWHTNDILYSTVDRADLPLAAVTAGLPGNVRMTRSDGYPLHPPPSGPSREVDAASLDEYHEMRRATSQSLIPMGDVEEEQHEQVELRSRIEELGGRVSGAASRSGEEGEGEFEIDDLV